MASSHPTHVVRFNLLATLLGVSIPFAVEDLVKEYSPSRLIATIAFFITALNFFHGKVVTLEDEDYNFALIHRPTFALMDFVLNTSVILTFVFMAFFLGNPLYLLIANIVIRALDSILVLFVRQIATEQIRRAQSLWLIINCIVIGWALIYAIVYAPFDAPSLDVSRSFLLIVLFDILLDYLLNHRMYFSSAGNWHDMAEFWDAAQGEEGDCYRRKIIVPAILREIGDIESKRILDLGCGNGCIARVMAKHGATVAAVDKYEIMLDIAKRYRQPHVLYRQIDLDTCDGVIEGGNFDLIIACFSLQDCESIEQPLRCARKNLASNGKMIIVFENDISFQDQDIHVMTRRRPLDPPRTTGNGRRWLIHWQPQYLQLAQCDQKAAHSYQSYLSTKLVEGLFTVTRHWDQRSYLQAASSAGLRLSASPQVIHASRCDEEIPTIKRYQMNPKFGLMVLGHNQDEVVAGADLPLVLIAGGSGSGKSYVASHIATEDTILIHMDDFYLSEDDPRIPLRSGRPDWESRDSVDMAELCTAVENILKRIPTSIPRYDMQQSRRCGEQIINPLNARIVIVEGVFVFDLFPAQAALIMRLLLVCPPIPLFFRRIRRDLHEKRRGLSAALLHALGLLKCDRRYYVDSVKMADYVVSNGLTKDKVISEVASVLNLGM
jgi:uridine kinase